MGKQYTEGEVALIANALAQAGRGELAEIKSLLASQNGQEVEFEATCLTKEGEYLFVTGIYDGSWDEFSGVSYTTSATS